MKKIIWLVFLYCIPAFLYAQYDILVWQDEFNYTGLPDPEKWSYDVGGSGWGNNELQYYTDSREENARVENGNLIIEARREDYGGKKYTSARLVTKNKGDWAYGRIEVKARLPEGVGTWPAVWMLPTEWIYGSGNWPDVGEIDIMEHVGYDEGVIHGTIHTHDFNHMDGTQKGGTISLRNPTGAFHVYAIEWTEDKIEWFVDDQKYFTFENNGNGWSAWPFDHPFHLILNIAIGGDWGGVEGVDNSIFPQKLEIDYVRVYKSRDQLSSLIEGPNELVPNAASVSFSPKMINGSNYNWSVPDDSEILSQDNEGNLLLDWGCEEGDVIFSTDINSNTYRDTIAIAKKNIKIRGDYFWSDNDVPLDFFLDSMHSTTYEWTVPGFSTILSGQATSSLVVDWGQQTGNVSVTIDNNCVSEQISRQILDPEGQYPYPDPYQPHLLPGTINAIDYDYGGEGIAYHDLSSSNQGDGPRHDEGVDTEYGDPDGNVGWIDDGEWLEYSITVEDTSWVNAGFRMASLSGGGPVQLKINDEEVLDEFEVSETESWFTYNTQDIGVFQLTPEDTVLRVEAKGGSFNLAEMIFTQTEATSVVNEKEKIHFNFYPNPVESRLVIQGEEIIQSVEIWDIMGKKIRQITDDNKSRMVINTSGLSVGLYILRIKTRTNQIYSDRFFKR
jgi:beta-glucanase (GH16 family)